jgi:hypothetical protein
MYITFFLGKTTTDHLLRKKLPHRIYFYMYFLYNCIQIERHCFQNNIGDTRVESRDTQMCRDTLFEKHWSRHLRKSIKLLQFNKIL